MPDSSAIVAYLFNTYPKQMAIFKPPNAQACAPCYPTWCMHLVLHNPMLSVKRQTPRGLMTVLSLQAKASLSFDRIIVVCYCMPLQASRV